MMTLHELKSLLKANSQRAFRIQLPDGQGVPLSFHVTEVCRLHKTFLDCGGKMRELLTCQLQIWVGQDDEHRIETGKMALILEKARSYLPDEDIPVEIEYEERVISQYAIHGHEITADAVILRLAHKHTECLAPELCGLPSIQLLPPLKSPPPCCGPSGC